MFLLKNKYPKNILGASANHFLFDVGANTRATRTKDLHFQLFAPQPV
jgi:hypothetical protein